MAELKPCPFCGGTVEITYTSYDNILKVLEGEEVLRFDNEIEGRILTAAFRSTTFIQDVKLDNKALKDKLKQMKKEGAFNKKNPRVNLVFEDGVLKGVLTEEGTFYRAQKVLISTGGLSYSATGSSGDGYELAKQAGHTIVPTRASLVGIYTAENLSEAAGLSLKNVTLRLYDAKKKKPIYEELGEMLITHDGISGPLVLSASSFMSKELCSEILLDSTTVPSVHTI